MPQTRTHRTALRIPALLAATAVFLAPLPAIAQSPASGRAEPASSAVRYIKSSHVNVRSGPGTKNAAIDVATLGFEVRVYFSQGDWSRISPPGEAERWVYTPLLQPDAPQRSQQVSKAAPKSPNDTRREQPAKNAAPQQGKPNSSGIPSYDRPGEAKKPDVRPQTDREAQKPR